MAENVDVNYFNIKETSPIDTMKRYFATDRKGLPPTFNILGFRTEESAIYGDVVEMMIISWREPGDARKASFSYRNNVGWTYEGEEF